MGIQDWRQQLNDNECLTSNGKLIGYTLANYYRVGSETFPSIATLEICSQLSRNTVLRAIKELQQEKMINVVCKIRKNRSSKQNHYEFIGATIEPLNELSNEPSIELSNERSIIGSTIAPEIDNKRNKKKEIKESADFSILNVSEELQEAYKILRKSKKAPDTQLSINLLAKKLSEAENKGYSRTRIIETMISANWLSFEPDWLIKRGITPESEQVKVVNGMSAPIIN